MRIHVLGSAAGGGVPQWNCRCLNCRAARRHGVRRTQSSVVVSADEKRWVLLNASPDLCTQFASFAALTPRRTLRGSAIEAVVLTDGELDHVTGLLSLREASALRLVCTRSVRRLLTQDFPLLPALRRYARIEHTSFPARLAGLRLSALEVSGKAPPYARRGGAVGLRIEDTQRRQALVYLPGLPAITKRVNRLVAGSDCLLVDGTFWADNEMTGLGLTRRTARKMGHVPISGADGSLAWLRQLDVPRKVYIHINNTNPILRRGSSARRDVEAAGVEVADDGMDIRL